MTNAFGMSIELYQNLRQDIIVSMHKNCTSINIEKFVSEKYKSCNART